MFFMRFMVKEGLSSFMKTSVKNSEELDALTPAELYTAIPVQNQGAKLIPVKHGMVLEIPLKEPSKKWSLVALFVPFPKRHRLFLDELGASIFSDCDGSRTVRGIISRFADRYRLSFLEARQSIVSYLASLLKRGAIAVALTETEQAATL